MIKKREGGEEAFTSKETHRNEGRPGLLAYVRTRECLRARLSVPAHVRICVPVRAF